MNERQSHRQEVQRFLQSHFSAQDWQFSLPHGWGHESYFASSGGRAYFVKLGVQAERYQAASAMGLTPPVLTGGELADGTSLIVQPRIQGRTPTRADYRAHLEQFATMIQRLHHSLELQRLLPETDSDLYRDAGLASLSRLRGKWLLYRAQVPQHAAFVDGSLAELEGRVGRFQGRGLVASHNDICNANWLLTPDGQLYLVDLDAMSLDDPALDIGATLWWYYPPELRGRFLEVSGYAGDEQFQFRMQVRMAMHCLDIALPRRGSFDQFTPASFAGWLVDFRAAYEGKENPQGFE